VNIELSSLKAAIDRWFGYVEANDNLRPIGHQLKALFTKLQSDVESFRHEVDIQRDHLAKMGDHETELNAKLNAIGEMALSEMQRVVQVSGSPALYPNCRSTCPQIPTM
jgi:hypothetical protein